MLQALAYAVAAASVWRPYIGLVALVALGALGSLLPEVQDARGLTVIVFATAGGCLRYVTPRTFSSTLLLWPASVLAALLVSGMCAGFVDGQFLQLAAGGALVFTLVVLGIRSPQQASAVVWAMVVVAVIVALTSASGFVRAASALASNDVGAASQIHGANRELMQNPNYYPPFILPGLAMALALMHTLRAGTPRWLLACAIAAMVAGTISTLSRGGVIAVGAALCASELLHRPRLSVRLPGTLAGLAVVGACAYAAYPAPIELLTSRFSEEESTGKWNSRSFLMATDIERWKSSPVVGHGLGSSVLYRGNTPHTGYTGLLAESGTLGFCAFYAGPLAFLVALWRLRRRMVQSGVFDDAGGRAVAALLAGVVSLLVLDAFSPVVYQRTAWCLLAIAGLAVGPELGVSARCFAAALGISVCQTAPGAAATSGQDDVCIQPPPEVTTTPVGPDTAP